ncbi:glycosyltransferase [uncultured Winogradskyella sp.]|uniref:glycosyltransferase n=1 Tax=uncultured Winogradskyella sp. TaxID=395353 RepID=UPI002637C311|nr:glycosyltransferase [uncultured Winogradskyella sp.]
MRIIHIVEDYSITSGGIRTVVKSLHEQLLLHKYNSLVVTPFFEEKDEGIVAIPMKKKNPWVYSSKLDSILRKLHNESSIDVIHIHGVWMHPQYYASKFAYKNNISFVISFHGMYEPWLWKSGNLKKRLYSRFLTNKYFSKAKVIHSITNSETSNLSKTFKEADIIEIPNLIRFRNLKSVGSEKDKSNYILFLGRLDPIKGIDLLIDAFHRISKNDDLLLKIAGPINSYKEKLQNQVEQLSLENKVEFLGLVKGIEKQKLFENALALVAPSYSEVIGMVNLESALFGTVVITTHATGLSKDWSKNGGFLINPNIDEIAKALQKVLSWDNSTLKEKESQLKQFVRKNYSWEERFIDWENLYKHVCK